MQCFTEHSARSNLDQTQVGESLIGGLPRGDVDGHRLIDGDGK